MFSQILSQLNWLHIGVSALAYFALGAIWYSPILFSKTWVKAHQINVDHDKQKGMVALFVASFICMFITAIAIAVCQFYIGNVTLVSGIKVGLFLGFCFNAMSISINFIYLQKPMSLFLIDAGYQVLGCGIVGAILGAWH